ncbi:MAG TPA: alpha/beta hydrolase [Phycisphaerales bacterium]|nr:alpha/beta hydrolase [Phycisphaerales bacterium]
MDTPAASIRRSWKRRLRGWLVALAVVYGVWCVAVWSLESRLLFPTSMIGARPPLVLPEGGSVTLVNVPGPETGVRTLVMRPERAAASPGPVVVMFHGNAELARDYIGDRLVDHLRARGVTVVFPEYRGYGDMPGSPSQKGIGRDMVAVLDWAVSQPWCDRSRVAYFGSSLGTGVACQLAADRPPSAGLILQSPFTSVASFAKGFGVPSFLVRNPFRNDRVLQRFDGPVLIIHGARDSVVPVAHGRALAKVAKQATYVELDGDHFHDWTDWKAYLGAVDAWLTARGM